MQSFSFSELFLKDAFSSMWGATGSWKGQVRKEDRGAEGLEPVINFPAVGVASENRARRADRIGLDFLSRFPEVTEPHVTFFKESHTRGTRVDQRSRKSGLSRRGLPEPINLM